MKTFLLIFLLILPLTYAQEITLNIPRDNYTIKETLQADVTINVNPINEIKTSNFILLDENGVKIPIALFIDKLSNDHYFIYFNIPELQPGYYKFLVDDIRYINKTLKQVSQDKIIYIDNSTISLSINPGIILQETILEFRNNGIPIKINITSPSFTNLPRELDLYDFKRYNIKFPLGSYDSEIKLDYADKSYIIKLLVPYKEESLENFEEEINQTQVITLQEEENIIFLNSTLGTRFPGKIIIEKISSPNNPFYVKNNLDLKLTNLKFSLTGNLNQIIRLNLTNVDHIDKDEIIKQYIWVNENRNSTSKNYNGYITIMSDEGYSNKLYLNIDIKEEKIKETIKIENKTLSNLTNNQSINKSQEKNNTLLNTSFLLILIIIVSMIIYFIKKSKKKTKSFEEYTSKLKR